jgi:hypothetical protein
MKDNTKERPQTEDEWILGLECKLARMEDIIEMCIERIDVCIQELEKFNIKKD